MVQFYATSGAGVNTGDGLMRTYFVKPNQPTILAKGAHPPDLSLRAQRGNLVAVALVVCRRVFYLNEIATLRLQ